MKARLPPASKQNRTSADHCPTCRFVSRIKRSLIRRAAEFKQPMIAAIAFCLVSIVSYLLIQLLWPSLLGQRGTYCLSSPRNSATTYLPLPLHDYHICAARSHH